MRTESSKLDRLRSLTPAQRNVLAASVVVLPLVRLSLRVRGFRATTRRLAAMSNRSSAEADLLAARQAADAVAIAARVPVGARCLARSLVLWFLLRRRGIDAQLVLGAGKPSDGALPAHAWVELSGVPVNDAADIRERFGSFGLELPPLANR
jgi:hypothetical protein